MVSLTKDLTQVARCLEQAVLESTVRAELFGSNQAPRIGRFALLRLIGTGGMGMVYAAYDEELDRKVAIKMVRPELSGDHVWRARALREAQAMAKLSHHHVAQVYEVGDHQGLFFVAMEFVRGPTMRQWLTQQPRAWRDTLALYLDAGEGLAAAHTKGLVHLDFKPDNVMIDESGRVLVLDFGLARPSFAGGERLGAAAGQGLGPTRLEALSSWQGTPGYMAPEQERGWQAGPASDQFGFCAALVEGICGHLPCDATDLLRYWRNNAIQVPHAVIRVLARGMTADPALRWPDMPALLKALERAGSLRRRRRRLGLSALALAVGLIYFLPAQALERRQVSCGELQDAMQATGSSTRRQALLQAMGESHPLYAQEVWQQIEQRIKWFVGKWQSTAKEVCEGQNLENTPEELFFEQLDCLAHHHDQVSTLIDGLRNASIGGLEKVALASASVLRDPAVCLQPQRVQGRWSASARQSTPEVRRKILHVDTAIYLGHYIAAKQAIVALAAASNRHDPWLTAQVETRRGKVSARLGEHQEAEQALVNAIAAALQARALDVAIEAAIELVDVVGVKQARYSEGLLHGRYAKSLLQANGGDDLAHARLLGHLATIEVLQARYSQAAQTLREALAAHQRQPAADPVVRAQLLGQLAQTLLHGHHKDAAYRALDEALALLESVVGSRHPELVVTLSELGKISRMLGSWTAALEYLGRALDLSAVVLPSDHPDIGRAHGEIAAVYFRLFEPTKCWDHGSKSAALLRQSLGAEHPDTAIAEMRLGVFLMAQGELDAAQKKLEDALNTLQRVQGAHHPALVMVLINLGDLASKRSDYVQARQHFEQALGLVVFTHGEYHPSARQILLSLLNVEKAAKRPKQARRIVQRILRLTQAEFDRAVNQWAGHNSAIHDVGLELVKALRQTGDTFGEQHVYHEIFGDYLRLDSHELPRDKQSQLQQRYASFLFEQKRFDEAVMYWRDELEEIQVDESSSEYQLARIYFALGKSQYCAGKASRALGLANVKQTAEFLAQSNNTMVNELRVHVKKWFANPGRVCR